MATKPQPKNKHRLILRRYRTRLTRRTPGEWRSAIDAIADPSLRVRVASIVWWDFFSLREIAERWPDLDDLVKPWVPHVEIAPTVLEAALRELGYHRSVARARCAVRITMKRR